MNVVQGRENAAGALLNINRVVEGNVEIASRSSEWRTSARAVGIDRELKSISSPKFDLRKTFWAVVRGRWMSSQTPAACSENARSPEVDRMMSIRRYCAPVRRRAEPVQRRSSSRVVLGDRSTDARCRHGPRRQSIRTASVGDGRETATARFTMTHEGRVPAAEKSRFTRVIPAYVAAIRRSICG